MTSSAPPPHHPVRLFQTLLHLGFMGTVGAAALTALFSLLAGGMGLVFAAGIGLVVLVGLVYAMFGIGWFETARVNGLYGLDVSPPLLARVEPQGFVGWLKALWRQLGDGPMWRGLADFALACLLGGILVPLVRLLVWSVALALTPLWAAHPLRLSWLGDVEIPLGLAPLYGALGAVVAIGIAVGIALLHRILSIAIIGSRAREEALTAQARTEQARARQSAEQREGAVRAADVERTRIERDLHDGVQPRLVSVGMTLGLAQQQIDQDPESAKALISEAHTSTKAAITELRQLARGIHASVLDDRGLDAALSALAGRSHIPVSLDVRMDGRVDRDAEAAVYFVIAEALTNAAKHSRASECRVTVRLRENSDPASPGRKLIWARVEDDGVGGAHAQPGGGLDGITNRVRAAGGTIRIDSPAGGPTAIEVNVPCAS